MSALRFALMLFLLVPQVVFAADSRTIDPAPFLRLETGMHTAAIKRISVDAAERYVVTASHDKTARTVYRTFRGCARYRDELYFYPE
jgi:hypothetical protein